MSQPITVQYLRDKKSQGILFSMLTAYDASIASICEAEGVDVLLVGDSLGNVVQGHDTTVHVTIDDMIYHGKAVARGAPNTLRMVDMPYLSYTNKAEALLHAKALMQDASAHILKLEVNPSHLDIVKALVDNQVPVCAHIGLTPQTIHKLGKFKTIGKTSEEADMLFQLAQQYEDIGADALLLECVPNDVALKITKEVSIPVIGIGCGQGTDGQVLVVNDVIGTSGYIPFFAKNFLAETSSIQDAIKKFHSDVTNKLYPQ